MHHPRGHRVLRILKRITRHHKRNNKSRIQRRQTKQNKKNPTKRNKKQSRAKGKKTSKYKHKGGCGNCVGYGFQPAQVGNPTQLALANPTPVTQI